MAEDYADRVLRDGVYEVAEDCEVETHDEEHHRLPKEVFLAFELKHPDFVIASAYETNYTILLSKRPTLCKLHGAFNYGSTNLLEDCPKRLLILAEND